MALRSSFGDILEPGFRKIFDDKYQEIPEQYSKVYHVMTSDKQAEKDSAVTGFGLLQQTDEGDPIQYEDPIQMYDVTYVHLKYTKGFKVSKELWEDDLYNIMNRKPAALGRSARRTAEYYAAQLFNNAFTSTQLGGDGQELTSTAHPRSDGGTAQSNASSTSIVLNETNLEVGKLAMRGQLDDKGMRIMAKADTLLVPPALEKEARILVESTGRPESADNDVNVDKGTLRVVVWDYLTSTTNWFLIDSGLHEINWFWRVRPEFKQDESFDTDMALYKTRARFSKGFSDWRGVWGSKGDGAAYSG
jgi:phage major head subunit gpT-like protein